MAKTLALLSGGLDSVAALLWARRESPDVEAVFFHYGQPASAREIRAAIDTTQALGVTFHRCDLQSAFYGGISVGLMKPTPSRIVDGRDTAFLPGRNAVMLSVAAARACGKWPTETVRLVVGFNAQDQAGFPDCRGAFLELLTTAINTGGGNVTIAAPWLEKTKREIVDWVRANEPDHMVLIDRSWSCYRQDGPCGECTACVSRSGAL